MAEYMLDGYHSDRPAAFALPAERVAFIRRTYAHLAGAILAFAALETLLITSGVGLQFTQALFSSGGGMLMLMVLFIGGGYLAQYWAQSATSRPMQYAGLGLYVLLEVLIFLPLLTIAATRLSDPYLIPKAGLLTMGVFAGLSMTVLITRQDFSFLGPILSVVSFMVLGLILCSFFFPINLGTWFSFAMVGLAAAYIIYDTSNVLHHYRTDQYVGASLQLFASVALMFYYILRLFMSSNSRD